MVKHSSFGSFVRSTLGIKLGVLQQGSARFRLTQPVLGNREPLKLGTLPNISLVTPSYNQGCFIGQTIESVVSQQYLNLEYIVQDNQSDDETLSILESVTAPNFTFHVERDAGQADAINKGFARCKGEIMGFLNSDDILLPGALVQVARIFQENPQIDVVYGNRVLIDTQGSVIGRWVLPCHDGELLRYIDYIPQETLFWRRSLWDRVGGRLDETLAFALDWELLLRFVDSGARFAHIPHFLGGFRIHQEQKTTSSYESNGAQEMRMLRGKFAPNTLLRTMMPFRHLLFLFKHVYADRRFSSSLKVVSN